MERPTRLLFRGSYQDYGNGYLEPDRHLPGIPARDLDASDIALLSDEQLADALAGADPLYRVPPAGRDKGAASGKDGTALGGSPAPTSP